ERFRTITKAYYRGAMGIVLMFDVTDKISFKYISHWANLVSSESTSTIKKVLVGNKIDMRDRVISYEEGKSLAIIMNIQYFEVSAKTNIGIDEMFNSVVNDIVPNLVVKEETLKLEEVKSSNSCCN